MRESPVFAGMKAQGRGSHAPLTEAFARWDNLHLVLGTLFELVMGFGVIWYTTQFYALLFLTQTLKVDPMTANILVVLAVVLASPLFIVFGALSDRIGRKWLVLGGILLGAVSMLPIFHAITHFANPALEQALASAPVVVAADPADCQLQFNPTGTKVFLSSCDTVKGRLAAGGVGYTNEAAAPGSIATGRVGGTVLLSVDRRGLPDAEAAARAATFGKDLAAAIQHNSYPAKANPAQVNKPMVVLLFTLIVVLAVSYGPVAALMVELFPARLRYSSLSLPYHIGTGWFGGLTPAIAFALVAYQGDVYVGLWFPTVIALGAVGIGALVIADRRHVGLNL